MNLLAQVKEARKLFEFHNEVLCETCKHVTRKPWFSFRSEVIDTKNPLYEAFSALIRESEIDEDTTYTFTVEVLNAMDELLADNPHIELDDLYDELDSYAEAPMYTMDRLEWLALGNESWVDDAIAEYGTNDSSIIDLIGTAYSMAWEQHFYNVVDVVKKLTVN